MRATAAASTAYMYSWVPVSSKWPRRHSMTHAGSSASYAAVRMALHRQADREPLPRRPTQGLRESEPGPLARPRSRPSPRRRSTWANFSPRSTWANFSPRRRRGAPVEDRPLDVTRSRARPRRAPASRARARRRPPARPIPPPAPPGPSRLSRDRERSSQQRGDRDRSWNRRWR